MIFQVSKLSPFSFINSGHFLDLHVESHNYKGPLGYLNSADLESVQAFDEFLGFTVDTLLKSLQQ